MRSWWRAPTVDHRPGPLRQARARHAPSPFRAGSTRTTPSVGATGAVPPAAAPPRPASPGPSAARCSRPIAPRAAPARPSPGPCRTNRSSRRAPTAPRRSRRSRHARRSRRRRSAAARPARRRRNGCGRASARPGCCSSARRRRARPAVIRRTWAVPVLPPISTPSIGSLAARGGAVAVDHRRPSPSRTKARCSGVTGSGVAHVDRRARRAAADGASARSRSAPPHRLLQRIDQQIALADRKVDRVIYRPSRDARDAAARRGRARCRSAGWGRAGRSAGHSPCAHHRRQRLDADPPRHRVEIDVAAARDRLVHRDRPVRRVAMEDRIADRIGVVADHASRSGSMPAPSSARAFIGLQVDPGG